MARRYTFVIILLLVIFGGTFGWFAVKEVFISKYFTGFEPPPVTVSTVKVVSDTWQPTLVSVGSTVAVNGIDVTPEVSGQVMKIYFKSGDMVKAGQPLVQLDDDEDQQQLKSDLAQLNLDKLTFERQRKLYATSAVSQSDFDTARAKLAQSKAKVATDKVIIAKKKIVAPFAGRVGIRKVSLGQYIAVGTALVTLQSIKPLYVDFSLPEEDIQSIYQGQPVRVTIDAYPKKVFNGKITAINSKVSTNTRTIEVRAEIPNQDGLLYPGIFADVKVVLPEKKNVVTVPQTAVSYSLYGDLVYIVTDGKDKKGKSSLIVKSQFVTVGKRLGSNVAITKGLKVGQTVVSAGQLKLHDGDRVTVNNKIKLN